MQFSTRATFTTTLLFSAMALGSPVAAGGHTASMSTSGGLAIDLGVGYTHLRVGETKLLNEIDFLNENVLVELTDHDGHNDGIRFDLSVAGIRLGQMHGRDVSMGLRGFYSHARTSQSNSCDFVDLVSDCAVVPLFDPDPSFGAFDYSGGFYSSWLTRTKQEVSHWGASTELRFGTGRHMTVGLKDEPVYVPSHFQWLIGAGVRQIKQDTHFYGEDFGPSLDPVTLDEDIDTTYYGAYIGMSYRNHIHHGLVMGVALEGGLYSARTNYDAHYTASETLSGFAIEQTMSLSDHELAFIGAGRIDLEKDMGSFQLGVYGIAEYYSYAPVIAHNKTDVANGTGDPADGGMLVGPNDGTHIHKDSATALTIGGKVRVPLN